MRVKENKMMRYNIKKTPKGIIRTAVPLPCLKAAQITLGMSRVADLNGTMSYI